MNRPDQLEVGSVPPIRGFDNDMVLPYLIDLRGEILGERQIDSKTLWHLFIGLRHPRRSYTLIHYPADSSAADKSIVSEHQRQRIASILGTDAPVYPVRTVTLRIDSKSEPIRVLVTGVERQIDSAARRFIAEDLGVSNNVVKAARINPQDGWDPMQELGLRPGIIGPFVPPSVFERFGGVYVLEDSLPETTPVEFPISDRESIIVRKETFEELLWGHQGITLGDWKYKFIPQPST